MAYKVRPSRRQARYSPLQVGAWPRFIPGGGESKALIVTDAVGGGYGVGRVISGLLGSDAWMWGMVCASMEYC